MHKLDSTITDACGLTRYVPCLTNFMPNSVGAVPIIPDPSQAIAKKHHEHELRVYREQLRLAQEEAARRGLLGAGAGGFAENISPDEAEKRTESWFDWIDPFLAPGTAY